MIVIYLCYLSFRIGYDCPIEFNPADFLIHTLAIVPGEEEACRGTVMVSRQ